MGPALWIGLGMVVGGALVTAVIGYHLSKGFNW